MSERTLDELGYYLLAGAGGAAINPALGSFAGPIAGTLATTSYIESCQRREGKP